MSRFVVMNLSMALLFTALLSGCAWSIGGHESPRVQPTTGEELLDLKRAKDAGAMTEEEYEAQKKRILTK